VRQRARSPAPFSTPAPAPAPSRVFRKIAGVSPLPAEAGGSAPARLLSASQARRIEAAFSAGESNAFPLQIRAGIKKVVIRGYAEA